MRYDAYIAFAARDARAAFGLAEALEQFRVPRSLAVRLKRSTRIRPIFLPSVHESTNRDIGRTNREALASCGGLIVLCSKSSAESDWIDEQIDCFKKLNNRIQPICVLVDSSESDDTDNTIVFPRALLSDGAEPLAADLRRNAEPKRLAMMRIVASLLECSFDVLRQRWRGERRRRNALILIVSLALIASAIWSTSLLIEAVEFAGIAGREIKTSGDARKSICALHDDLGIWANKLKSSAQSDDQKRLAVDLQESAARIWFQCAHDEERWGFVDDYDALYCPPSWANIPPDLQARVRCVK